jgi:hypothetical protein
VFFNDKADIFLNTRGTCRTFKDKVFKCSFFQYEIHYLGHIISGEGIALDPSNLEAILEWLMHTNVHEVCIFMGLVGYYRRFIKGFKKIANPIT